MKEAFLVSLEALAENGTIGALLLILLYLVPLCALALGFYFLGCRTSRRCLSVELEGMSNLRDRLAEDTETITALRARIARHEAARSQAGMVLPEGFLAAMGRELCEGNSEREVALCERYLETHAEALHRAFLTMTRATLNAAAEDGNTAYSTALGYALGALAVRPDDESTRELAEDLAAAAALPATPAAGSTPVPSAGNDG